MCVGPVELQHRQHQLIRLHGQGGDLRAGGNSSRVLGRTDNFRLPGGVTRTTSAQVTLNTTNNGYIANS